MNISDRIESEYLFPIPCDGPSQTMDDYPDAQ